MATAQPPDDDSTRAIRARAGESPTSVDLPFWVDACLALDPPRKPNGAIRSGRFSVYPIARALMAGRINARGDEAVDLDRSALARWAGHHHARNCRWIVDYLERIGFLTIQKHYAPGSGQRSGDTFDVFVTPPDNYVGPQSYAELDMALAHDEPHTLFSAQPESRRSEPRSAHAEVGDQPRSAHAEVEDGSRRSEPRSAHAEVGDQPRSAHAEVEDGSRRSEPRSAHAEVGSNSLKEVNSFLPEGRKEGINEGDGDAPHRGAGDATPEDDELTSAVRDLVRRLPWRKAPVGRTAKVLAQANQQLVPAIVAAIREHEFTLDAASEHALSRMTQVRTVEYLVNAFRPERLTLPEPDDVLDLPPSTPAIGETDQAAPAESQTDDVSPQHTGWCGDCIGLRVEGGKTCSADCTTDQPSAKTGEGRAALQESLRDLTLRNKARAVGRRHRT